MSDDRRWSDMLAGLVVSVLEESEEWRWVIGDPDIRVTDGVVTRTYKVACYRHETKMRGAAELGVLFWLAPRGRWGKVVVEFPFPCFGLEEQQS